MHICDVLAVFPLSYAAYRDGKSRTIPNIAVLLISICAVVKCLLTHSPMWATLLDGASLGAFVLLVAINGNNGIGGGDIKLSAAIGTLYGFMDGITVLIFATFALIVYGALRKKEKLPFAPFVLGAVLAFNISKAIL